MIDLKCGDCLELMKDIPDKSIDMILCDLPYGTTACKWDTIIPFELLWEQYKRIIKIDGTIVLFGSQPFTSELIHSNINWYSHSWIWEKNKASNFQLCNKMPMKITEDIIVFYKPDNYDLNSFKDLKEYFKSLLEKIGKSKKQIKNELGQGLDHCFRFDSLQWNLPTEKNYNKIFEYYKLKKEKSYIELKEKYKEEYKGRNKTYHPQGLKRLENPKVQKNKNKAGKLKILSSEKLRKEYLQKYTNYPCNVLKYDVPTKTIHPAQKPVALLEYLIKTYTNENETVLDNCMGSGSTGVACVNTNRNFIGIELDEKYFNIAKERIENEKANEDRTHYTKVNKMGIRPNGRSN